jgi:hypothetical protein
MIEAIRKLLSLPYLSGTKYRQWENEIITWLPKEEDNPDIAKRRPIALLEVMKKMHIGVKKNELISIAIKHKMISDDHHGALAGRSTTRPLMKTILALEDARYYKRRLVTADVDLKRADDMVPAFIKEMALWVYAQPVRWGAPP